MRPETRFTGPDLCALPAREVVDLLHRREVSPAELVAASAGRMEAVEDRVNAVVTRCPERAEAAAAGIDRDSLLGGLPIAIKDLTAVAGVRTTLGTPGLSDWIPEASDPLVARLEARGGLVMGKTNTPEMGAGGNTFNAVFGMTRNPWDLSRNAGGSSGGAAVSLATGEVWLSHGSDLAGSLRTPAGYCSVVGLRPSPGVAGGGPAQLGFSTEGVQGPMARDVADCALFLDAMAGFDPVWPLSYPAPDTPYRETVARAEGRLRIAFAPDLGGFAPVEPEVAAVLSRAMQAVARDGHRVEEDCPDLPDLDRTYRTLRAMHWAALPGRMPEAVQAQFKPTLMDNVEQGRPGRMSVEDVYDAQRGRSLLYDRMAAFLARHEVLAFPVTGAAPGPVEAEFPDTVAGEPVSDYLDWLRFSFLATTTGLPALSMPAGFTEAGLPVGLQLVGPPRGEAQLLRAARLIEQALALPAGPFDPMGQAG
ncbi:amidase [Aquicoccus sp. SCR17]|nr:amidase [Carideicomes alvinocaridis]